MTGRAPLAAAFRLAWSGADPGPTDHTARPPAALTAARPVPLPREGSGPGALLALSLAADPDRTVGGVALRRVPSAGGRYPVDARVGGRVYDPLAHALDDGPGPPAQPVVLTLAPQRTRWRYGPRSLPVLLLDLGHAAAAVLAAAATLGTALRAHLVPAGETTRVELTAGSAPAGSVPLGDPGPAHPAAVLHARRSTPFGLLGPGSGEIPPSVPAAAAARLGPGQHAAVLPAGHPLLPALTGRACGHPDLTAVAGLLVVTGDADPGPDTVAQHVRAGLGVHDAWLAATAAGAGARPVGCWVEAVLRGPGGRGRVQHALALGAPP
ncbi:hypothetical protein [Pseudonocardia spirodelae]|uniref:Uncharacterized protein n=1 Tax=Pseudonocardia spirodelae TaxID=3133431 RepID=A0ABU8T015_9PSEU